MDANEFSPDNTVYQNLLMEGGLKGRVEDDALQEFVAKSTAAGVPAPIGAKASVVMGLIYGNVTCNPTEDPYKVWSFDESIWGLGAVGGTAIGFIYTAYNAWDPFFQRTTGFHVQGAGEGGGILQINFLEGATPIGQFNGAMAGAGALEGGANGRWKHS